WVAEEQDYSLFIPGQCSTTQTTNPPCTTSAQSRRVLTQLNPTQGAFFSTLSQTNDGGTANYNGVLLTARHRFSHNFTIISNYTYSHCISDADFTGELTNSRLITQSGNLQNEVGNCGFDERHIFNTSLLADTPRFENRWLRLLATGWQGST